ncbi:hypothetical protein Adi01nite_13650 [Amorphoplanes digitatis]|uniref:Immunity protein 53 n=1 Tax=Actinoplanes digitatis TaxID=1868 RepID=A0A7W7HYR0_9ACTN|nr:immunity 53 family protein [Actinoplanes digitatis]MBB4763136.1 hypothetical protein [Actinoplanes digitatis]GID91953.1 hypothetical protein Adi01nite_13650 [Actinoplanes digitatis]
MHDEYDELAPDVWTWLQAWYVTQCDGEWEHEFGVKIETVDNPGWSVDIDIAHTGLAGKPYGRQQVHRSQHDWVITWEENSHFHAACGPLNLGEALHTFRQWAEMHAPHTKNGRP